METFRGQTHRNNSTTIDTYGGVVTSTSASNLAQSVGTASFVSRHIRLRYYASVVSTGRYTGVRGSSQQFWSVTGGFRYVCDFNISDTAYSSSTQQFYGLGAYNTDLNYGGSSTLLVSSLTNIIGIGNDSGDANLQVIYNDGSGSASKIDLGSNFPANRTSGVSQTTIYSIQLYNEPGSSNVLYEVINKENGSVANGTLTTNLPSSNLLLNFFASRAMGSGGGITNSGQFDLMKLGVYSLLIMEIFRLVSSMKIEDDGTVNVCLKPDNNLINEYIATYRTYESLSVAEYSLNSFIIEMTPLLYNDFKNMDNISIEVRNLFTL